MKSYIINFTDYVIAKKKRQLFTAAAAISPENSRGYMAERIN